MVIFILREFHFFIYLSGSVRHEYLDQNFSLPVWRNAHNNWRSRSLSSRWMSHEAYQLRAYQALSPVRTLKIWMNRYATLLEDLSDNSHMCLTNDSYLILCIPTNEWPYRWMSMLGPIILYVFSMHVSLHGNNLRTTPQNPTTRSYLPYMEREP